jgi:alkaline phosphatase D
VVSLDGEFRTPAAKEQWQNVKFTVVTGQAYWDLDDDNGFHIYPAMGELDPDFIVPTGDTVYLDSESPRARTVELARYHWHRMYSLPRHIAFHQTVPGYWEKDDHDAWCNDCWPTYKAPWMNPLTFQEGLEIFREQVPMGEKTFRTVRWGKGLQIWMVEGRDFRSPNNMPDGPDKLIWGKEQRDWLLKSILDSDADFRVLISPTPIVGPDRDKGKNDNHSNDAFATAGNFFRDWTAENKLTNFYVCCGDRQDFSHGRHGVRACPRPSRAHPACSFMLQGASLRPGLCFPRTRSSGIRVSSVSPRSHWGSSPGSSPCRRSSSDGRPRTHEPVRRTPRRPMWKDGCRCR